MSNDLTPEQLDAIAWGAPDPRMARQLGNLGGRVLERPVRRHTVNRSFPAGEWSDLTADWALTPESPFQLVHNNLTNLRARARAEFRKNDYARRAVGMMKNGIVGPEGFSLQCQFEDSRGVDTVANRAFEEHFRRWADDKRQVDWTERQDLTSMCHGLVGQLCTDGEFFIRKRLGSGEFGLQLEIFDPMLIDVTYNDELRNGNKVRFGIELDGRNRPVRYWTHGDSDYYAFSRGQRTGIPADEVYHVFIPEAVGQLRGLPWLATPMYRMHMLDGFEEASIVNARVGASKMGFKKSRDPEAYEGELGTGGAGVDEITPGMVGYLGENEEWVAHNPDYPAGEFEPFVKQMLRGVASGLELSYPGLANDLAGVNYNSLRHDALETRDVFMRIQEWFIGCFLRELWSDWLFMALPRGIPIPRNGGGYRPAGKPLEAYKRVRWQGRRWQWVDPLKEVQASKEAIALGVTTRAQVIRDSGRDPEEVFAEWEIENDRFGPMESRKPDSAPQPDDGEAGSDQPGEPDG